MASQQATPYALLTALALGATLALLRAVEGGTPWRWTAYGLLALALAYTQYFGVLVVAAHGVWAARYRRDALRGWAAAAGAAGVAFLPWLPTVVAQSGPLAGAEWYRLHGAVLNLGDLLGLYAFGGGLFGSATYYYPGQVTLIEQAVILLPFLAAIGLGLWALRGDRPARALLVLTLAVPIGLGLAAGFVRPAFTPRWFVFLAPFYAMLLGSGIGAAADRLGADRLRTTAAITLCLLLYGVPVLGGYYRTEPEGWRDVAAAVRPLVRPGDAFVFLTPEAEMRLLFYFPQGWPSVVLTPVGEIFHADRHAALTQAQIEALGRRYPRIWVVVTTPVYSAVTAQLRPALSEAFHPAGGRAFPVAFVGLFESKIARGQ